MTASNSYVDKKTRSVFLQKPEGFDPIEKGPGSQINQRDPFPYRWALKYFLRYPACGPLSNVHLDYQQAFTDSTYRRITKTQTERHKTKCKHRNLSSQVIGSTEQYPRWAWEILDKSSNAMPTSQNPPKTDKETKSLMEKQRAFIQVRDWNLCVQFLETLKFSWCGV